MIGLRIKSIISPDAEVEEWPLGRDDFCLFVEIEIGERGAEAADIYSAYLLTEEHSYTSYGAPCHGGAGAKKIIVKAKSYSELVTELEAVVQACAAEDGYTTHENLREKLWWEYDDQR